MGTGPLSTTNAADKAKSIKELNCFVTSSTISSPLGSVVLLRRGERGESNREQIIDVELPDPPRLSAQCERHTSHPQGAVIKGSGIGKCKTTAQGKQGFGNLTLLSCIKQRQKGKLGRVGSKTNWQKTFLHGGRRHKQPLVFFPNKVLNNSADNTLEKHKLLLSGLGPSALDHSALGKILGPTKHVENDE